jgi:hypothetical protein
MNEELETILELNECLLADGFNDAIIGISQCENPKAVYSIKKCIDKLIERDGMSKDEAIEFFSFNVSGSYMGEKTPIFITLKEEII